MWFLEETSTLPIRKWRNEWILLNRSSALKSMNENCGKIGDTTQNDKIISTASRHKLRLHNPVFQIRKISEKFRNQIYIFANI